MTAKTALVGIILAIVGAVMLAIAIYWGRAERQLLTEGVRATGTVIAVERSGGSYFPVFRFRDAHESSFEVRSQSSSSRYKPGDRVPVAYDPERPLRAQIDEGLMSYIGPSIIGGMGVLFFSVGTLVWFFRSRFNADGELTFDERKEGASDRL